MPKTLLTVATRKGTFILESDDRRDWKLRGPDCEAWPVYHAIYDPTTGEIYAAAASELGRLHRLAQRRPRGDLGAVERGPLLRRRRRPQDLQDPDARARGRPVARRGRGAGDLREP